MQPLHTIVVRVRRRLIGIGVAAGTFWALAAAAAILLLGAWFDLLWELPSEWRVAAVWIAGLGGVILLTALAAVAWRTAREAAAARRLDRAAPAAGQIFTGWELEQGKWGLATQPAISVGLATLAAAEAARAAGQVPLGRAAPWRSLWRALCAVALVSVVVAALKICLPGMAWTQWSRFVHPYADVPPFSLTEFEVTPGNKNIVYGSELEISATVRGAPVEQVELVLASGHGREPPLPMFPEAGGRWRTVLTKVVEPTDYFVRAYRARSKTFHLGVITVPQIDTTKTKVRIVQPAYAHRPPYEGPLPKEGVSGLRGTKVQVFLTSNRPLRSGEIGLTSASQRKPRVLPMTPTASGSQEVAGEFTIAADGKFECRVIDEAGQPSEQTFSGNVAMLADARPFVRLIQPPRVSLATPSAALPVVLSAEDDCGISRLQLYRSLNDSRPLPLDLPIAAAMPRRLDAPEQLPLESYGLAPGDVIKLFGRVEDNDPAGAKGAESPIALVRIISDEDFQRLVQAREGMESLMSKYDDARRRMERAADEVEGLRKKTKKRPAKEKAGDEARKELRRLRDMLRREAEAMRQAAKHQLPFDLDKSLTPEIERLSRTTDALAKEMEQLQREQDLMNGKLSDKLDDLARRMASARKLYGEMASEPLEYVQAVFPLMADQSRFVMLVLWQRDLAERLASMKGKDKEDNPSLKARVRDLEEEQRQVRDALARLLDDLQEHIDKLPDKPELTDLRKTSQEFVKKVRGSGASEAMSAAEAALAEFAVTRGHEKAKLAADILAKFLNECQGGGSGSCMGSKLVFQPKLCNSMGNTLSQLLAGLGMGGSGMGSGNGMDGGFGDVGLFGGLPEMLGADKMGDSHSGNLTRGRAYASSPTGDNPDDAASRAVVPGEAAGLSEGAVPTRYRRQVGQYFQRIAEETTENRR
jgi:hypothetical protein